MPSSSDITHQIVASFQKAITLEMDAMRERLGAFEVPVGKGRVVDEGNDRKINHYSFQVSLSTGKLVLNSECSLRHDAGDYLVSITGIENDVVTLACENRIRLHQESYTLVIYPWFLFERLLNALADLLRSDDMYIESALRTFGKESPIRQSNPIALPHSDLNGSQRAAVKLCCESDIVFVWGPPGTGKTTTLAHIVTELLNKGYRILVTSTTNAAVDQALAKLKTLDASEPYFDRGEILRVGQTSEETHGAGLRDVLSRLNGDAQEELRQLKKHPGKLIKKIQQCDALLGKLDNASKTSQLDLFNPIPSYGIRDWDLEPIFAKGRIDRIVGLSIQEQKNLIIRRRDRLETLRYLYDQKMHFLMDKLRNREKSIISDSRLILSTMTNVYISQLLDGQRFDVVIIEEAGMAILPILFYCTSLAREKVILVGDPKQLPPIVQSRDAYVRKAMGRSIFEVSVPQPYSSDVVVMLDTQYRMHPAIGNIVSRLFYGGKLRNDRHTSARDAIAAGKPYAGEAVVIIDTEGQTACTTQEGSYSRINRQTAELCSLLAQAALEDGQDSIAIITPYVAQSRLIRALVSQLGPDAARVACRTVHRFQGNERDIVILDTVDTDPMKPGVLLTDLSPHSTSGNLINVSISRARGKLIIVSDLTYFMTQAQNSVMSKVLGEALTRGVRISWKDRVESAAMP